MCVLTVRYKTALNKTVRYKQQFTYTTPFYCYLQCITMYHYHFDLKLFHYYAEKYIVMRYELILYYNIKFDS